MSSIQIFENPEFGRVRTIEEDGQELFCGSDVAKALGYSNARDAVARHCRGVVKRATPISGKMQEINFITRGDVYRLVTHSKLPSAERFEAWVFDEVIPAIHDHGAYMTPQVIEEAILNPDTIIGLATALKDEQERNRELRAENQALAPKAKYFDELVDRHLLTTFRETAKQFKIGEQKLIHFLIERKYIYRDRRGKLLPYARKNYGLFEVKEYLLNNDFAGLQTFVTPRGREKFRVLLKNS